MTIHYKDDTVTLHHGDALDVLRTMPDGSVDCIVTSPPYFGLRDYGVDGQIGAEASPAQYVASLLAVLTELHRVLTDDGSLWLNLGDSYAGRANAGRAFTKNRGRNLTPVGYPVQRNMTAHAPYKSLLGIPWRVALAAIDAGWVLRSDVIWAKPNGMPESVADRPAAKHEHVFLLTKGPQYWFDLAAIRVPSTGATAGNSPEALARYGERAVGEAGRRFGGNPGSTLLDHHELRNPGNVWSIPTQPFPGAHFATMPVTLAERCVQAGCKPGGTVLDPFSGSGTTGLAAERHGRRYVGIDLNAEYLDMSLRTRLRERALNLGEATA